MQVWFSLIYFFCVDYLFPRERCADFTSLPIFRRVGEHDTRINDGDEVDIKVQKIFKHPNYNSRKINNDIALLKLSQPAIFNTYVSPACLPPQGVDIAVGTNCFITGKDIPVLPSFIFFIKYLITIYFL